MLRLAALLLLLINGVLLAVHAGWIDGRSASASQREPERLARQLNPQAIQLLPATGGSAPAASSAASASASASTSGSLAPAASAAPPSLAAATTAACLEAGPLDTPGLAEAQRGLLAAGVAASSWQVQALPAAPAYLVYMGRFGDPAALQRKRDELRDLKVAAVELKDAPGLQPGLTLGRHPTAEAAEAALAGLALRGVHTARVVPAPQRPGTAALLRLPAADAALRNRLAGLRLPGGQAWRPCGDATAASAPAR